MAGVFSGDSGLGQSQKKVLKEWEWLKLRGFNQEIPQFS